MQIVFMRLAWNQTWNDYFSNQAVFDVLYLFRTSQLINCILIGTNYIHILYLRQQEILILTANIALYDNNVLFSLIIRPEMI